MYNLQGKVERFPSITRFLTNFGDVYGYVEGIM